MNGRAILIVMRPVARTWCLVLLSHSDNRALMHRQWSESVIEQCTIYARPVLNNASQQRFWYASIQDVWYVLGMVCIEQCEFINVQASLTFTANDTCAWDQFNCSNNIRDAIWATQHKYRLAIDIGTDRDVMILFASTNLYSHRHFHCVAASFNYYYVFFRFWVVLCYLSS